jgi:hypothetical protein
LLLWTYRQVGRQRPSALVVGRRWPRLGPPMPLLSKQCSPRSSGTLTSQKKSVA